MTKQKTERLAAYAASGKTDQSQTLIQLTNAELELIAGGPINIVRNGGDGHGGTPEPK
ncbi:MAG: hypothetical protein AAF215_19840 [Cyanobacteria bacterium P01_A01_bin.123]